jgi:hypothetical protein
MRSRILVTAFLVFATAGAATLLANGIAGACTASGCGSAGACCAAGASNCDKGCSDSGTCGSGCCDKDRCTMGCCESASCTSAHHAQTAPATAGKQWSIVNFMSTVRVGGSFVSGRVLIVHGDAKMARGEPCTTFYRFDRAAGPREELVSFHCKPRRAAGVSTTKFTTVNTADGVSQLTEYQLAGDTEAHGIPR